MKYKIKKIDKKKTKKKNNNPNLNKVWVSLIVVLFILSFFGIVLSLTHIVFSQEATMCCEKTTYGAWCQNEDASLCDKNYRTNPSSCDTTSYCKLGCCYDSDEGTCMINTPQKVCEDNKGVWKDNKDCEIPQCDLGCCVLGTQAAFVPLQRCKKLSSFYGLQTDFRTNVENEFECIAVAQAQDLGACVYETENFERNCKFTTRSECSSLNPGDLSTESREIKFHKDYLCSAPELGTICEKSKKTTIVEGKDEVYFVDTCGNVANIYDSTKAEDNAYWTKIVEKEDSCGAGKSNANSATCGNCDYFLGSIGREYSRTKDKTRPKMGEYICRDLSCKDEKGNTRKNGESWCVYDEKGKDVVGARHFRKSCFMGEVTIEPCADFRQQICIENKLESDGEEFSTAACIVNKWQDCITQDNQKDCENYDRRDCQWSDSFNLCFPEISPGLNFWEEESDAKAQCALASKECIVEYEKGFFSKEKCKKNCECLEDSWAEQQLQICESMGDCGAKINFIGVKGNDVGYKLTKKSYSKDTGKVIKELDKPLFNMHMILNKLGLNKFTGKATDENNRGHS